MADTMKLNILSPERRLLTGVAVTQVTLPGAEGQIQVLAGYAPFVSTLETGLFSYELANGTTESGFLSTGFVEVLNDEVTVLAETLELKSEINLTRARKAQERAEQELASPALDEQKFRKYQLKLQRAMIRQQFAGGPGTGLDH